MCLHEGEIASRDAGRRFLKREINKINGSHRRQSGSPPLGGVIAAVVRGAQLFDIRSAFLHGRAMTDISTQERVMARSLVRQVVEALILATQSGPIPSREDFLDGLFDKGAPLI